MNFSSLYETYAAMREPSFLLKIDGSELPSGGDVRLLRAECELTCAGRAGMLCLRAALNPRKENGAAWLEALQPGAACSLSLGYAGACTEVFRGFLYDMLWEDPLNREVMTVEAVCLDVRGRLMLSSCADAGAKRNASALIDSILNQSCCAQLAPRRTVKPLPGDWDLPVQRPGTSDFGVVQAAADFFCYEFYAFADELYFGEPRPVDAPAVTFDGPNGLVSLARRRTLAGQCAAVAVSGADDRGERIYSRQPRSRAGGFGTDRMDGVLTGDLHQPEAFVRTMAQAQYLSRVRMERRQRRAGGLTGRGVGLPELRPGRFIRADRVSEPVAGLYYVQTVRHLLDETGFESWFEAEE